MMGLALAVLVLLAPVEVLRQPIEGSDRVAIVTVFRLGEAHEGPGRSGLAHLAEHVYASAATERRPARSVEDIAREYPLGWNAHTSFDYTVIATVVPRERLADELQDHADRMTGGPRVTAELVEREKERILEELDNMYARSPAIAVGNRARELLFPPAPGTRRGGTPESLAKIDAAAVEAHLARYYRPINGIVSIAGAIDGKVNERSFIARLVGGAPPPTPTAFPKPAPRPGRASGAFAAAAFPAPRPGEADYAPFLVAVVRLARASRGSGCAVNFPPFEDGRVLTISSTQGFAALNQLLSTVDVRGPVQANEAEIAAAWVLGHQDRQTEYEAAFRRAMIRLHGIDEAKLRRDIGQVTSADVERVAPHPARWPERAGLVMPGSAPPPRPGE